MKRILFITGTDFANDAARLDGEQISHRGSAFGAYIGCGAAHGARSHRPKGVAVHRTVKRILLITAAFALFVVPAAAIAAAGFTEVADIQWMKDNAITAGCNPPTNDRYCPSNNVTREQMSAFMHRLAANQVVDAATAIEAENVDTLDGKDSTDFLGAGAKAVGSDKLDGKTAGDFVSGAS